MPYHDFTNWTDDKLRKHLAAHQQTIRWISQQPSLRHRNLRTELKWVNTLEAELKKRGSEVGDDNPNAMG